jgi:hypothetical protein
LGGYRVSDDVWIYVNTPMNDGYGLLDGNYTLDLGTPCHDIILFTYFSLNDEGSGAEDPSLTLSNVVYSY